MKGKSDLLEYLLMTESRPGMYFGSYSVHDVRRHLDGWRAHRRIVEDGDSFADHFFETFHDFVGQQLNDKRTIGWDGLVQERAHSDREGFDLFMSLVRTFASRRLPEDE